MDYQLNPSQIGDSPSPDPIIGLAKSSDLFEPNGVRPPVVPSAIKQLLARQLYIRSRSGRYLLLFNPTAGVYSRPML